MDTSISTSALLKQNFYMHLDTISTYFTWPVDTGYMSNTCTWISTHGCTCTWQFTTRLEFTEPEVRLQNILLLVLVKIATYAHLNWIN